MLTALDVVGRARIPGRFLTIGGRRYLAQRYAIDWNRLDPHGRAFVGDPANNEYYLISGDRGRVWRGDRDPQRPAREHPVSLARESDRSERIRQRRH